MTLLATLWLAVLHLLAAGPAAGAARGVPSSLAAGVPGSADSALLHAPPARDEALRPPRPLPAVRVARPAPPRASSPPSQHAVVAPVLRATVATVDRQRIASRPSHAHAARGDVLPYFPTAPPGPG
jgi:hypothetical protein